MPVQSPSAATPPRETPPQTPSPAGKKRGALEQFWQRVTDGLELNQLWRQFETDARASYRLYQRDLSARQQEEDVPPKHRFLHTAKELAWAVLEKLSPARRVLLLLALVFLLFGGANFTFTDQHGQVHGVFFDLHVYGGLLLLVLLSLEIADRVVMKRDLEIARDIQKWLLPEKPPIVPGLELAFAARPANTVAGDFYDVFPRSGPGAGESRILLVMADVAGKSIPAALLMATFQASLKTLSLTPCSLGELVAGLNHYACSNSQGGLRFTTALLAEFDPGSKTLHYINAGHNAPLLQRADGGLEHLSKGGLPLGIQESAGYESGDLALHTGDRLVIFTDGLVEAENTSTAEFGEPRLVELMQANPTASPAELLPRIMSTLDGFVGTMPQHDDVTCMVVRVL